MLSAAEIELILELEPWQAGADYDRLGLEEHYRTLLEAVGRLS